MVQLKAEAKSATADVQIKLSQEADTLKQGVDAVKAKLADVGEDAWEQLKGRGGKRLGETERDVAECR